MAPVKAPPKGGPSTAAAGHGISKKVGGIPVWGWAAGVLVAILIGLYFRNRKAAGGGTSVTAPTDSGTAQAPASTVAGGATGDNADLASLIQDLADRLTADETTFAFGPDAYTPADQADRTYPENWGVARTHVPQGGAKSKPFSGAVLAHVARSFKGHKFVLPAVHDGVKRTTRASAILPRGSSARETHSANVARAVHIAGGVQAHHTVLRGASRLPALSPSPRWWA